MGACGAEPGVSNESSNCQSQNRSRVDHRVPVREWRWQTRNLVVPLRKVHEECAPDKTAEHRIPRRLGILITASSSSRPNAGWLNSLASFWQQLARWKHMPQEWSPTIATPRAMQGPLWRLEFHDTTPFHLQFTYHHRRLKSRRTLAELTGTTLLVRLSRHLASICWLWVSGKNRLPVQECVPQQALIASIHITMHGVEIERDNVAFANGHV
jgi:hypothetical protein